MRDAAWIAGQTPLKPSDHELVEKIIVDEETITIKLRRGLLLGGHVPSSASEAVSDSAVELTAAVAFTRRGAETKLVLPGLAQRSPAPSGG